MASISRKGRRYLRTATDTSHDVQVFLDENPLVASGLATVGSLIMNAVMQSKYGPMVQELMNPGSTPEGSSSAEAAPATPATPKARKGKKGRTLKRVTKKVTRKKATRKKVARKVTKKAA